MTALNFTRAAIRVQAMRLTDAHAVDVALNWLHAHGVPAAVLNGQLRMRTPDGWLATAHLGKWLMYEPDTGFFDVVDGDEHRPDGCAGGLGVACG